jgi:pectinesterase
MKVPAIVVILSLLSLPALVTAKTISVAIDGSGDFQTVQEAVDSVPEHSDEATTIHIKPGTYAGQIVIRRGKNKLMLEGEDSQTTRLTWDRNVNDPKAEGADKFNPGIQVVANDFRARRLTFENTSGDHGQALAMRLDGDRTVITECRIIGWQDTLMINGGRDYFKDCYIAGRVDFIFGSATAWFERCEIHSRNGGYVTAASTARNQPFGFVFSDCKLTGDAVPWQPPATGALADHPKKAAPLAALGRPWRPYGSVTYLNCELGSHIKPEGWDNWRNPENEKTARYAEHNSRGPGVNPDKRVKWSRQLTNDEAEQITVPSVLAGADNWNPVVDSSTSPSTQNRE